MLNSIFLLSNIALFLASIILVTHHDPIKKLLSLICLFFSASLTFLTYNFYFLGLTYLIVYIGAIAILFLFVIMMVPLEN
jgi:NADH:ubiquinone oxidoreductase subunit 6 (subunit J)